MKKIVGTFLAAVALCADATDLAIVYPTNAPGGTVVAPTAVSNEVADLIAQTIATNPPVASVELLRAFTADTWAAVKILPTPAGYAALESRVDEAVSNCVSRGEVAQIAVAAATPAAIGALPAAGYTNVADTTIGTDPYQTATFSESVRCLYWTGSGTCYVGRVTAPNGVPSHMLLSGFDGVVWSATTPRLLDGGPYTTNVVNVYEVISANGTAYLRRLWPLPEAGE